MGHATDQRPAEPSPPQRPTAPLTRAASNAIARLERALRPAATQ